MKEYMNLLVGILVAAIPAVFAWVTWRGQVTTEMTQVKEAIKKLESTSNAKESHDRATFQEIWRYINSSKTLLSVLESRVEGLDQAAKVRELLEANQAQLTRIEHKLEPRR